MEYKIVYVQNIWSTNRAIANLTRAVTEAIALGWEPLGGIAIVPGGVCQALIKRR